MLELLADRVRLLPLLLLLLLLFLREQKFSEGTYILFPKEKAHFYFFFVVIGLDCKMILAFKTWPLISSTLGVYYCTLFEVFILPQKNSTIPLDIYDFFCSYPF